MADIVFPIGVVMTGNIYLIYRVIRKRPRRRVTWRRQRKLTIQLLCFSILLVIFWFPLTIYGLPLTFMPSSFSMDVQVDYLFFLIYMVPLLLPFVVVPHLSNFTQQVLGKDQRNVVPTRFTR